MAIYRNNHAVEFSVYCSVFPFVLSFELRCVLNGENIRLERIVCA